ncbi:Cullin binding-domain-containing protein, partial [Cunninghamella echinulata]
FQQYSDPDTPKIISPEGTQQFLQDLGISVEEKLAIVIAWKLNAATMGYITQEEWLNQKCMDVDVACALWSVLFENQFPILQQFIQFLQEKMPVRVINRDQWQNLYEFITTVSVDLSDYDEAAAWPVLFDEYVDWKRSLI